MSIYNFQISGKINVESSDEASDVLQLILEDKEITVDKITIIGRNENVSICKEK